MTDNSHSDIDRAGDLLLLLGCKGEQKTVRVSSKILSLASPVFAVMLSRIFAEGQNSGDENWTVSLSHDDPEAMLTVLRVLHFKPTCTTETSLLFLAKMAEVCEKYDLTEPLKGWTEAALRHGGEIHGELGSSKLLKISCALGSHQAFWLSSYKIIMRYLEEKVPEDQDFEIECATIPDNLLASIKTHRHYVFHDIQDKVEHIISPYVKAMAIEVDDTITHFFRLLNQITLWPLSSISSSKSKCFGHSSRGKSADLAEAAAVDQLTFQGDFKKFLSSTRDQLGVCA